MVVERWLAGILLGALAIGCAVVLRPFFSSLLWAGILVFTTWPLYARLRFNLHLAPSLAALAMVLLATLVILLPLLLILPGGVRRLAMLRNEVVHALAGGLPAAPPWLQHLPLAGSGLARLWNGWTADLSSLSNVFRPYLGMIVSNAFAVLFSVAGSIAEALGALFIAFFFYYHGEKLGRFSRMILARLAAERADGMITMISATVRGVIYGIVGTAIAQGLITILGLAVAGVPNSLLLGLLAGALSVIPFGATVIWLPACIWLASQGFWVRGLILGLYEVIVLSGADTLVRPWFVARGADLPFLLTLFGVVGGAVAFGVLGIFLGPVLLGIGYTLATKFVAERAR